MPLYEYECGACGQRFEIIQKFSDGPPEACPRCGKGPLQRLLSSPAIQFKGTGWYVTDYASKKGSGGESAPAATSDTSAKNDGGGTGDTKKTETPSPAPAASKD